MFKPSVNGGISLSVFEYPQLYSRWVAYFWVKMKYLSISLLLTWEGGKRGRHAQGHSGAPSPLPSTTPAPLGATGQEG